MPDFMTMITTLIAAGAVYGGIRADLKHIHSTLTSATHDIARAHARLDDHIAHCPRDEWSHHRRESP